jgi:hypothetical protein
MATLALEYRVHGDGAGRDEEERSGEGNSYRGAVEWMKVEVSWGRLLRGHSRGGLRLLQREAFFSSFDRFAVAPMLLTIAVSQGSLADRLFLQFSRGWQIAVATIKWEGR